MNGCMLVMVIMMVSCPRLLFCERLPACSAMNWLQESPHVCHPGVQGYFEQRSTVPAAAAAAAVNEIEHSLVQGCSVRV